MEIRAHVHNLDSTVSTMVYSQGRAGTETMVKVEETEF